MKKKLREIKAKDLEIIFDGGKFFVQEKGKNYFLFRLTLPKTIYRVKGLKVETENTTNIRHTDMITKLEIDN